LSAVIAKLFILRQSHLTPGVPEGALPLLDKRIDMGSPTCLLSELTFLTRFTPKWSGDSTNAHRPRHVKVISHHGFKIELSLSLFLSSPLLSSTKSKSKS
jgi:hypothetical protein